MRRKRRKRRLGDGGKGFTACPGYTPHRDTQWVRNSAAILHYFDGGFIEILTDGKWCPVSDVVEMHCFHVAPARPAGWSMQSGALPFLGY